MTLVEISSHHDDLGEESVAIQLVSPSLRVAVALDDISSVTASALGEVALQRER